MKLIKRNQKGLASIVVVIVLVALLSLISIGFARLMDRAVNSSLNNQLSTSAGYAAQSGINDTITYVKNHPNCATTTPATCSSTDCNAIFGSPPDGISQNFVSSDPTLKYSCILVNPSPPSLTYSQIPASESQVAQLNPVDSSGNPATLVSLMFSWQADGSDASKNTTACSSPTLYDENNWSSNNCPPLQRITLYPVSGNQIDQTNSHTYFLYPNNAGVPNNTFAYSTTDGSIIPVNCNVNGSQTISGFSGSLDEQCNVVINGLPAADSFYTRLTPIYDQAVIKIKANTTSGQVANFKGDQDLIDVTAQAGSAAKRLQAAVKISNSSDINPNDFAVPEDGLRSAETICKQLDYTGTTVTNNSPVVCQGFSIGQPQLPTVITISGTPTDTTASLDGSVNPNGSQVTNCQFDYGTTTSYGSSIPCSPSSPGSGSTTVDETAAISGLSSSTTYHFRIEATNSAGPAYGADLTFTTGAPACSGCTCDNSCGGGNNLLGFQYDASEPNNDAFYVSVQNNASCTIIAHDSGGDRTYSFTTSPSTTGAPYDLGPGDSTNADINCDIGSQSATRGGGGGGCAYYPVFDGWDYIDCVGQAHVHCSPYECVICYNPNGSQDYMYCEPYSGGVSGCTDPSANNYNPFATTDDGSCTYGSSGGPGPGGGNSCNPPGLLDPYDNVTCIGVGETNPNDGCQNNGNGYIENC